jgi:hypothetical protein
MRRLGAILGIALICAPARAERVAVPPVKLTGGGARIADGLRSAIAGGVAVGGQQPVGADQVDAATTPAIAACDTDDCLARLAELVGARASVRAVVEVLGSSNYSFRLELVDAQLRRAIGHVEDSCPICNQREAAEMVGRSAAALMRRWKAVATSNDAVRVAPSAPPVAAVEPPPPRRHYSPRGKLYLGLGVTTLLLGAGAIAGGGTLLALDGRVESVTPDPITGDPVTNRFEGKIPGAVLIAGGGLLLVGGGLLIWRATLQRH